MLVTECRGGRIGLVELRQRTLSLSDTRNNGGGSDGGDADGQKLAAAGLDLVHGAAPKWGLVEDG